MYSPKDSPPRQRPAACKLTLVDAGQNQTGAVMDQAGACDFSACRKPAQDLPFACRPPRPRGRLVARAVTLLGIPFFLIKGLAVVAPSVLVILLIGSA